VEEIPHVPCSADACFPATHLSTFQSFNDVSLPARPAAGLFRVNRNSISILGIGMSVHMLYFWFEKGFFIVQR
jgi:hypothetical protein